MSTVYLAPIKIYDNSKGSLIIFFVSYRVGTDDGVADAAHQGAVEDLTDLSQNYDGKIFIFTYSKF